jgi:hypothetical protein
LIESKQGSKLAGALARRHNVLLMVYGEHEK